MKRWSRLAALFCVVAVLGLLHGCSNTHATMKNQHGETFEVDVPAFSLDSPYGEHSVN